MNRDERQKAHKWGAYEWRGCGTEQSGNASTAAGVFVAGGGLYRSEDPFNSKWIIRMDAENDEGQLDYVASSGISLEETKKSAAMHPIKQWS